MDNAIGSADAERCIQLVNEVLILMRMAEDALAGCELARASALDQATDATFTRLFALEKALQLVGAPLSARPALARLSQLLGELPDNQTHTDSCNAEL